MFPNSRCLELWAPNLKSLIFKIRETEAQPLGGGSCGDLITQVSDPVQSDKAKGKWLISPPRRRTDQDSTSSNN